MNFPPTDANIVLGSGATNLVLANVQTDVVCTYFLMVTNLLLNWDCD
jgi:hypothetical protein